MAVFRQQPQTVIVASTVALLAVTGCSAGEGTANDRNPGTRQSACQQTEQTTVPQPTAAHLEAADLGDLPVARDDDRADLVAPPFSDPTTVTNPLFPISDLHSALLNGTVDNQPFRVETTLLPDTRIIEWSPGQCVKTLVSQYVAYLDGRHRGGSARLLRAGR